MESEPSLEALQKRIEKLENKPKDLWDIVGLCVIPLSIALTGYWGTRVMKEAELASTERLAAAQIASSERIATQQAQLEQGKLVALYMDALISVDSVKRLLAVEALSLVSPDNGRRFVEIVSRRDPSQQVRQAATSALSARLQELVIQSFSQDETTRKAAAEQLASRWASEPTLIAVLLDHAQQRLDHQDAIFNTLWILLRVDRSQIVSERPRVESFLDRIEQLKDRPATLKRAQLIRDRFRREDAGH